MRSTSWCPVVPKAWATQSPWGSQHGDTKITMSPAELNQCGSNIPAKVGVEFYPKATENCSRPKPDPWGSSRTISHSGSSRLGSLMQQPQHWILPSLPSWWGRWRAREYPNHRFQRRWGRNPRSRESSGTLALVIRTASGARNDSTPQLMITLCTFTSSLINLLGSPNAQNGALGLREQPQAFAFLISCNWGGAGNGEHGTRHSHRAVHLGRE